MNYKLQIHYLNDVTMWRTHVPTLINMNTIKSHFLHQYRLHSNGNGFKIVQKGFIKSSSNLQETYHLCFTCQHLLWDISLWVLRKFFSCFGSYLAKIFQVVNPLAFMWKHKKDVWIIFSIFHFILFANCMISDI